MTKLKSSERPLSADAREVAPHVVKMAPHFVKKIWGGQKLARLFGKDLSLEEPFGECWEVADLPEGQSVVDSGPLKGSTLGELSRAWGRALTGRGAPEANRFPLLVKILDAREDLSVQVHPGPKDLAALPGAKSKDEVWVILDVDEGAEVIHGLSQDGVTAQEFRRALEAGEVSELLERVPVEVGDVIRVEPGRIHAICRGVALLEVQEPSDTTYRVYDYERPGLDGRPRELHLEEALKVSRLGRSEEVVLAPRALGEGLELLVEAPGYRVERLSLEAEAQISWTVNPESPQVIQALGGEAKLADGLGGEVELKAFETAVVPAAFGRVEVRAKKGATLILSGLAVESGLVQELVSDRAAFVGG